MPLKVSAVSRKYKQKWALKDVSFELGNGTVFGIFGPTGSGKSILLRILAGREPGYNGSWSFGPSAEDPSGRDRSIPVFIGGERHIPGLFGLFRGYPGDHSPRGASMSTLLNDSLSSRAGVVLMDNPLCHLDANGRALFLEKLAGLRESSGKTIVLASPNFDDILQFCDEAVVLDQGEVLQTGTPEQIYTYPANAQVAMLSGRNNIFEARRLTSSKTDIPEFQTIDGSHRLTVMKTEKARLGPLNQNMLLSIRPEHVSISFGASFPEDNLLKATIRRVKFLGPNTLVELDAGGLEISALVMRLVGLKAEDECMLGMPPDRIAVFPS